MLDTAQRAGETLSQQTAVATLPPAPLVECGLAVGERDERGNTVKYIYSCDQDYVVYYSRLEHKSARSDADKTAEATTGRARKWLRWWSSSRSVRDLPYESEGVQAQLSRDPVTRKTLRQQLLPLGTERAKLQALLSGWPRRQSYDTAVATALQLALIGEGQPEARDNALQTLRDARASILAEREIAGKAQYARFTLLLGVVGMVLLVFVQHNLFKETGNFWRGAEAGLIGAVLSIAIGIRRRVVALDIGLAGNLSDSALRLLIGAVSGGTLVLLYCTGLLPTLRTAQGVQDGVTSMGFILLLGIIAGFVEQLVPSLLEDQAKKYRGEDVRAPAPTASSGGR